MIPRIMVTTKVQSSDSLDWILTISSESLGRVPKLGQATVRFDFREGKPVVS